MPKRVNRIPNPWLPYMDGAIWEFTPQEINEMPNWRPMTNLMHETCGRLMVQWYIEDKYYVRFVKHTELQINALMNDPDYLAGWFDE